VTGTSERPTIELTGPLPTGTWAAMSSAPYRRLFFSTAIVIFGVMTQAIARAWMARELTGTNAGLGAVLLVFGATMLVASPWGGVAADRFPKRNILLGAVLLLMTSGLLLGLAVVLDVIAYWMLLVASVFQAVAFAFYMPARIAFISEVVNPALLGNAIVLAQMAAEAMRVIAPALAGVLIGVSWFGSGGVFLLAAGATAISAVIVTTLPIGRSRDSGPRSPLAEMADAFRYVRATRGLGLIALTTIGVVVAGFPYLAFLPTLSDENFDTGAVGYGLMTGVVGLGAVLAGLRNARSAARRRPWFTIGWSGGALGASIVALGLSPSFAVALVVLGAIGACGLVFQTTSQALLLQLTDLEYHGRLQATVVLGFSGFGLAAWPLGVLADAITLRATLVLMGCVVLAIMAVFALARQRTRRLRLALELG
jgi:MFS family permease